MHPTAASHMEHLFWMQPEIFMVLRISAGDIGPVRSIGSTLLVRKPCCTRIASLRGLARGPGSYWTKQATSTEPILLGDIPTDWVRWLNSLPVTNCGFYID